MRSIAAKALVALVPVEEVVTKCAEILDTLLLTTPDTTPISLDTEHGMLTQALELLHNTKKQTDGLSEGGKPTPFIANILNRLKMDIIPRLAALPYIQCAPVEVIITIKLFMVSPILLSCMNRIVDHFFVLNLSLPPPPSPSTHTFLVARAPSHSTCSGANAS